MQRAETGSIGRSQFTLIGEAYFDVSWQRWVSVAYFRRVNRRKGSNGASTFVDKTVFPATEAISVIGIEFFAERIGVFACSCEELHLFC